MSSDINTELDVLRVAQSELASGSTKGEVYLQASPGAVMFLTERSVAQVKVASQIQAAILLTPPPNRKDF